MHRTRQYVACRYSRPHEVHRFGKGRSSARWFAQRGVTGNYHGDRNILFEEEEILDWILSQEKEGEENR